VATYTQDQYPLTAAGPSRIYTVFRFTEQAKSIIYTGLKNNDITQEKSELLKSICLGFGRLFNYLTYTSTSFLIVTMVAVFNFQLTLGADDKKFIGRSG
jgi:hypothetical protein